MANKQQLELTWIGKENRPRLEPRILLEDPARSYHAPFRNPPRPLGEGMGEREDLFDNRLIFGDNLLALKALEAEFAGRVKCVFIDPPYNTGSAFTHYDDGVEHSIWLSLMRVRLEIIRRLLSGDGSLWITIDDNECHYLKVLCDEVFGRTNFVSNVIWQKKFSPQNDAKWISNSHDHVLCYAVDKNSWFPNALPRSAEMDERYKNPDNDPRGPGRRLTLPARSIGIVISGGSSHLLERRFFLPRAAVGVGQRKIWFFGNLHGKALQRSMLNQQEQQLTHAR